MAATLDVDELGARLRTALMVNDWRATIVLVVAGPSVCAEAERVREQLEAELGLGDAQVVRWVVDQGAREQLAALNQARDSLLAEKRLIWLRASTPADVRFLRRHAPDLSASFDVFAHLRRPLASPVSWDVCRRQLCELMAERHATLDFTGLLPASVDQTKLPLDELYQPLVETAVQQPPLPLEPEARTRALLVLGHPGTGKTTYLRHLARTYAQQRADPLDIGAKVPVLLSLSDYGWEREHGRVRSLMNYLPEWLGEQGVEGGELVGAHLDELLLLLDGLDELPAPEARRAVLGELSTLLDEGALGGVVVSGRSYLVDELRASDHGLRVVSTRVPEQEEIRAFLTSFVRLRTGSTDHAQQLLARIEGDEDLRVLARTPLMLAFMAILDELEGRLPDRRIEIYYRLGEMLVDRWTRARSIGTSGQRRERPTRADALRVLGPLAWWTVERGGGAVPEHALLAEIERIEARRETPAEAARRARALLELLRSDTALLVPRPGRRWSFVHTSIAEYFAGIEVERDRQRWQALLDDPFRAQWREILLFCAGQLGVIEGRVDSLDALVDAVLNKSRRAGRYDARYASLLAGLLMESPGISRRQIDRLVERLLELVLVNAYADDAARQVQLELTILLISSRGAVADSLKAGLRRWFSDRAGAIRWDRLLAATDGWSRSMVEREHGDGIAGGVGLLALSMLVTFLCTFSRVRDYELDFAPTFSRWAAESDWRYTFATWLAQADADSLERPFRDIIPELDALGESEQ